MFLRAVGCTSFTVPVDGEGEAGLVVAKRQGARRYTKTWVRNILQDTPFLGIDKDTKEESVVDKNSF